MEWCVGRLIDHVHLRAADFAASRGFYLAVLEALAYAGPIELGDRHLQADELYVEGADGGPVSRIHLAFQASSQAMVDRFYAAALAAGGTNNGPPGLRPYSASYYAAFVLDPDGNNIEAVHQGVTTRSAELIRIQRPD